jgi:hypothetical protein
MRCKISPAVSSSGSKSISDTNSASKSTSLLTYGLNHSFNAAKDYRLAGSPLNPLLAQYRIAP